MIGQIIIGGFVIILVAVVFMLPTMEEVISDVGASGAAPTILLDLLPLFIALGIALLGIAVAFSALKQLVGVFMFPSIGGEDVEDDEGEEPQPIQQEREHKQTYLEYVMERLKVERLMRKWR